MKRSALNFVVTFLVSVLVATTAYAQSNISILLPKEQGKEWNVQIDGKSTPGSKVLDELSRMILERGNSTPVVVLIPKTARFTDWDRIQGIVGKVGFLHARYFIYSKDDQKMIEVDRTGPAMPFSLDPGPTR